MSYIELTSEWAVRNLVLQCLSGDETLEHHEHFDLIAPKGIKNLNWPANTAIEIKPRIMYDTIERFKWMYDTYGAEMELLVLIVGGKKTEWNLRSANLPSRNVKIITIEDFLSEAEPYISDVLEGSMLSVEKHSSATGIFEKAKNAVKNDKISLFLGAGVSASAGVVTWDRLLEQLCIKRKIAKLDSDVDDTIKGRYIVERYSKKNNELSSRFYDDIRHILYSGAKQSSALITSIANLALSAKTESIITYNYDDLLEQEINSSTRCHPVYDKSRPISGRDVQVYHVHGFIPQSGSCSPIVLGEKEYHKIYQESYNWGNVEQLHALCRSTCFFIGLSMKDPNLRRLIDISLDGSENNAVHYAFLRRIEYNVPFTEAVLGSLGVNCIWYEQHEDLPKLINSLL